MVGAAEAPTMTAAAGKTRKNLTLAPETRDLIEQYAADWGIDQGAVVDRFVATGAGMERAERVAAESLGAMEELLRRIFDDYALQMTATLTALLDERFEAPHVEASTARLLLFALIAHLKSPDVAIKNEDEALRVARRGRATGEIPLLLRGKARHE